MGRDTFSVGLELMGMGRVDQVFVYNRCWWVEVDQVFVYNWCEWLEVDQVFV